MPVSIEPAQSKEAPTEEPEVSSHSSSWSIDLDAWAEVALRASLDAQAALHAKGLSYFIGRDGDVIEVLPGGEEKIVVCKCLEA